MRESPFQAAKGALSACRKASFAVQERPFGKPVSQVFILHSARFALPLNKISGASGMKIKVRFTPFYFAFRSVCITFAIE